MDSCLSQAGYESMQPWPEFELGMYIYGIGHYQVMLIVQNPLTLFCPLSLSSITLKYFRLHTVSTKNWYMSVFTGQLILGCPCVGIYRKILLMISSLLNQQCPACLVHLTWRVCEIEGKWQYNCFFMECCFKDLFRTASNNLVQFQSRFFSECTWCSHTVVLT